jgi:acyl dehydratase
MGEMFLDDLPAPLDSYYSEVVAKIGVRHRRRLGIVDALLIQRYAIAIGDPNPVYHDDAAARAAGYDGIIAPPNLLSGIMEWGPGRNEAELSPDGTFRRGRTGTLRVMGAGEEMDMVRPVTAGSEVWQEEEVESVTIKQGRSGPLLFVTTRHDFVDDQGAPYNRNRRTVMARL